MNIKELKEKMKNVPFGNSQFQILNFIGNDETCERIYRNTLLQLNQKLKTMQECSFRRKRKEIDIKEIKDKLKYSESYEKKRLEIDLEEAQYSLEEEIKFIEDCAIEIKTYEKILEKLPEYTREEFEQSERLYWEKRLIKNALQDLKTTGHIDKGILQSLEKLNITIENNNGQLIFKGDIQNKKEIGLIENK